MDTEEQKQELGKQKIATLQRNTIERMIGAGVFGEDMTWEKFYEGYVDNRLGTGVKDRFFTLTKPIEAEDIELIKDWMNPEFKGADEVAIKHNLRRGQVYTKIMRVCTKIVYQHLKELDL